MSVQPWCETCAFWKGEEPNPQGVPQIGECRRREPGSHLWQDQHWGVWPQTMPHDWCGEHKEREQAA